ncbi:HEAT repeat domain-containing protein [Sorangium sp. So ce291]|uniref:HEAT repeat domain-containing protein n=1 Tax=Sorangium sp. So ce291 TaxID=3133294 RepID=UPI003F62FD8C
MSESTPKLPHLALCYSQADLELARELITALAPVKRTLVLELWEPSEIPPGDEFARTFASKIDQADLVVILVSTDLLADESVYLQAERALELQRDGKCHVFPVKLRPSPLAHTPFEGLQFLPKSASSVVEHPFRDAAWVEITEELQEAARQVKNRRARLATRPLEGALQVLLAGPFFGLLPEERSTLARALAAAPATMATDLVRKQLDSRDTCAAHMAALLRFDIIIDLSPWATFAQWSSSGCMVVAPDRELPVTADGPIVLTAVDTGQPFQPLSPKIIRHLKPRIAICAANLQRRPSTALAIAGVDPTTAEWAAELVASLGSVSSVDVVPEEEQYVVHALVRRGLHIDTRATTDPFDSLRPAIGLNDYRRALRIVAGQVRLPGDISPRPTRDVFVEMDIHRHPPVFSLSEPQEQDRELREELRHREERRWQMPSPQIIQATSLINIAPRVLLWGKAGTGKSTLLRQLASSSLHGRFAVWLQRIPQLNEGESFAEVVARQALEEVYLASAARLRRQLRDKVESGDAYLLLDGFDESAPEIRACLPGWLSTLHPDTRVLLASRPSGAPSVGLEEVELVGLSASGPEQMLYAYFGETSWIPELLQAIRDLPDGPTWQQTPVLLALSARIYEEQRDLPRAAMDLYGTAIDYMLDRARRRWPVDREAVKQELAAFAARLLAPREGPPCVAFKIDEFPGDDHHREALRSSGIFTGRERLRFAHLSFGEYLAALADIDLSEQRAQVHRAAPTSDRGTLEVLPIAHAYRGLAALQELWSEAMRFDTPDHRLLRMLLRALAYGGEGAESFARQQGRLLIVEITKRLQPASGRFGDVERALLGDLERAHALLAPHIRRHAVRELEPLLRSHGDVGVEASTLLHALGDTRWPERKIGRSWSAVSRLARSLVRQGAQVDDIIRLTLGHRWETRFEAVTILGKYRAHWPVLQPLLEDPEDWVREAAVWALAEDDSVLAVMRERLIDDASRVRAAAVYALGRADRIALHAPALDRLLYDSDMGVVHAAVSVLGNHVDTRPLLRRYGWELLEDNSFWHLGDVIEILANDPDADELIAAYLDCLGRSHLSRQALTALSCTPRWRSVLIDMLAGGRDTTRLVQALAASSDTSAREAAARFLDDPDPWVRLDAALSAPDTPRAVSVIRRAFEDPDALFRRYDYTKEGTVSPLARIATSKSVADDEGIFGTVHQYVTREDAPQRPIAIRLLADLNITRARPILWQWFTDAAENSDGIVQHQRVQVLLTLSVDYPSRDKILNSIDDSSEHVRKAAVELLKENQDARERIRRCLDDDDGEVQFAALAALSDEPQIQDFLLKLVSHDNEPLRTAAFITLATHRDHRQRIVEVFHAGPEQVTLSAIVPLSMSSETRPEVYSCMDDLDSDAAKRVASLLGGDEEVRSRVRHALRTQLPRRSLFWGINWLFDLVAGDPELEDVFAAHVSEQWGPLVRASVAALAKYPSRRSQLFELVQRGSPAASAAAIRALANEPEMTTLALTEIQRDDLPGEVLAAFVHVASRKNPSSERMRGLIAHENEGVRLEAVRSTAGHPESWPALRAQLEREHEESVKQALLAGLARDPDALPTLRTMLRDPSSVVRQRVTQLLRREPLPAAHSVNDIPSVYEAARLADGSPPAISSRPGDSLLRRVSDIVAHPAPIHIDDDLDLAELLLGWLVARLAWASPDGGFYNGHTLGETEKAMPRILTGGDTLLIRVAMDGNDAPRERLMHPNHNLIEAWRVAQYLTSDHAPALVLACADVAFEHLPPPEISPGQVLCGPTFFGLRIARQRRPR